MNKSSVLTALAQLDSATVQNAGAIVQGWVPPVQDYSGPELRCMLPEAGTVVGYAVTAEVAPLGGVADSLDPNEFYDAIVAAAGPVVIVMKDVDELAGRGAVFGDEMAYRIRALGGVGAVIDGAARDVPRIRSAGLGLWATSRVPGHGDYRWVRAGLSVTVAGLRIEPGDILVCDDDGVARVPNDIAADVARVGAEVQEKEQATRRFFTSPDFSLKRYDKWKRNQTW